MYKIKTNQTNDPIVGPRRIIEPYKIKVQRDKLPPFVPANDNVVPQGARPMAPVIPAFINRVVVPFALVDFVVPLFVRAPDEGIWRYPANGLWEKRYGDFGPYPNHLTSPLYTGYTTHTGPITGQAVGGAGVNIGTWTWPLEKYGHWYRTSTGTVRYAHHSSYWKKQSNLDPTVTSHNFVPQPYGEPYFGQPTNPNIDRWMPSPRPEPKRIQDEFPRPRRVWIDVPAYPPPPSGTPPEVIPGRALPRIPRWMRDARPSEPENPPDREIIPPPLKLPPPRQHSRTPPRSREREGKAISKTVAATKFMSDVLDAMSEAGDAVDAVFKALDPRVQVAWKKKAGPLRPGEKSARYGIDGADWKLWAIWYNLDKLDVAQAFKNLAYNELEDKAVGAAMAQKNRIQGRDATRDLKKREAWLNGKKGRK